MEKTQIQKYYETLISRKALLTEQIENGGNFLPDPNLNGMILARKKGRLEEIDLIIRELKQEFDL